MTILSIVQDVAGELALVRPSTLVDASDAVGRQLKGIVDETAEEMVSEITWPELRSELTITLVSGQASYTVPFDLSRLIQGTSWNTDTSWPVLGAINDEEFSFSRYGSVQNSPWFRYRINGFADQADESNGVFDNKSLVKIELTPTPAAGDAGVVLKFYYFSDRAFRPKSWANGQVYSANTAVFNGTDYLYNASSGTSGSNKPTSLNSYNDGSITWTVHTGSYRKVYRDSDEFRLDERLLKMGIKWRFLMSRRLEYQDFKNDYLERLNRIKAQKKQSPVLSLDGEVFAHRRARIPDSGIGL